MQHYIYCCTKNEQDFGKAAEQMLSKHLDSNELLDPVINEKEETPKFNNAAAINIRADPREWVIKYPG